MRIGVILTMIKYRLMRWYYSKAEKYIYLDLYNDYEQKTKNVELRINFKLDNHLLFTVGECLNTLRRNDKLLTLDKWLEIVREEFFKYD